MASAFNTIPGFSSLKPISAPCTKKTCYYFHTRKKSYLCGRIARASSEATTINEPDNGVARANAVFKRQKPGFTSNFEAKFRFNLMEELMQCARRGDVKGATDVMNDMISAGLTPGPHSFHGLIVAHVFAADEYGVVQLLRKEVSLGIRPLEETFVAVVRLFGSKGHDLRGQQILASMENFKFDIRRTWLVLVEELFRAGYLQKANDVFLKGAEGGLRGTDRLYDLLIVENCKAMDHANALMIVQNMEAYGRMPTTFHFNCLLSVQATSGFPEIAANTFEKMECGEDFMKPDTETYNWVIEAHLRANSGDRLLVECFTKYCIINEALRHFRGLKCYQGAMKVLHNDGKHGDALSLYLRALCLEGRAVELLEALEAMASDDQSIAPRAMIVDRKGRTLVSSWIEPLQEAAELGFEVDHVARYIEEGGLTGERKRWVPRGRPLDPDCEGFFYSHPVEISYKQRCIENSKTYNKRLLTKLLSEGEGSLGADVTKKDIHRLAEKIKMDVVGNSPLIVQRPKAASKMLVSELKEELEGQGEPTDGNRQELYQRVQKKRRINRAKGIPLWVPPAKNEENEVDDELQELVSQLQASYAKEDNEYWRNRFRYFTGEIVEDGKQVEKEAASPVLSEDNGKEATESKVGTDNVDENVSDKDGDEDKGDKDEDEEEAVAGFEEDLSKQPLKLISQKLASDGENQQVESETESPEETEEIWEDPDEPWYLKATIEEICKYLKYQMRFDASEMYTIEDAWGWTWEKEHRTKVPETWTQEKEVKIAMEIMEKVIEVGGTPTIGDCAMVLRAAIRVPLPSAMVSILRRAHSLGYIFGSPLYDEVITLCMDICERDAAIAIVTDLEEAGITVPNETLDRVLQESNPEGDDPTADS
ncbi:uncharacterized protein LOC131046250 isoform X2 [Cryptomeria japonica]|uniref:uncharacterized protein LOC131046250 isoform X2 n=1 Tax=Cryptomeria japonica TaxID=3369 RepID=UPI0027DA2C98|nr:uncharacterized protein LOC131046250 isoform X2 [Cryptomeria japonica]